MKAGWEIKTLGQVCELLNRGVSPTYVESGGVRVLNQRCIRDHVVRYDAARRHDHKNKSVSFERFIKAGDVLVNSTGTGTLGRVAQIRMDQTEPTTVDSHVTIVRPIPGLFYPDFFGYMLWDIEDELAVSGEGCGGQTELGRKILAERFTVRYPTSVTEQHRIVKILDEAFENIATAKANAEKNLHNARALFESHLESIFSDHQQWTEKSLERLGSTQTGSTPRTSESDNYGCFIPFIKPGDFNPNGSLNYSNEGLSERGLREARVVDANAVLMVCIGATIGKCGISDRAITTNQQINVLVPNEGVSNKFVYYQMLTNRFQKNVLLHSAQATLPIISKSKWSALTIFVPPTRTEQDRLVDECDRLLDKVQRLESIYQAKIAALDELKKSLLHQAFNGDL